MLKKTVLFALFSILSIVLVACGSESKTSDSTSNVEEVVNEETNPDYAKDVTENPIVTITMESGEQIDIELFPEVAPNTVTNFISLAEAKFYDGTIFHRVIPGFMIQGGDPTGTGAGGPNYSIDGEFTANGFENNITHERGVVSMARSSNPNSAGSQFFIMVEAAPHLDGEYAAFGKVISGMEVVDKIVSVQTGKNDKPVEDQKMRTVTVDTKGFNYPQPVKNK